jgi:hypothetical protein
MIIGWVSGYLGVEVSAAHKGDERFYDCVTFPSSCDSSGPCFLGRCTLFARRAASKAFMMKRRIGSSSNGGAFGALKKSASDAEFASGW